MSTLSLSLVTSVVVPPWHHPKYRFETLRPMVSKDMQEEVENQTIIAELIGTSKLANVQTVR